MNDNEKMAVEVISHFALPGELVKLKVNTQGHINSTFISEFAHEGKRHKYTHQKINKNVFKSPDQVMSNIVKVTSHIQAKVKNLPNADKRCLNVIKTKEGENYYIDPDGEYWRTYDFIDDVNSYDSFSSMESVKNLGVAIGIFQKQLSDFDGSQLYDTIPHFHDMGMRYKQLEAAIAADPKDRVKDVQPELEFLFANRERGEKMWADFASGVLPNRVTHNDTKMNNVLFDQDTDEALCVIDLDTIMPGTVLFDTGDMIRTACNTGLEDDEDLSKVEFDREVYKALIGGYLSEAESFLTKEEREGVKESGRTITQIMAVRFLTDYIAGDVYYHIAYPEHNIVRCRTQLKLISSMDRQWEEF